jgi:hypothetical protein
VVVRRARWPTSTAKGIPVSVPLRRGALAVAVSLAVTAAPAATATALAMPAAPAQSSPIPDEQGLFGDADPAMDGVWRQSLALLAQTAAGVDPGGEAIGWLLGQQCEDGSFLAYRADVGKPCADVTAADTNATALATQALAAAGGQDQAVEAALTWLRGVQNEDGGWSYAPGDASDANSTAVVAGAFAAAGEDPAGVRRGELSPHDALAGMQLGCDAAEEQRGAYAWQPDPETGELFANDAATVDAVLAAYGSGLLIDPEQAGSAEPVAPPSCDAPDGEDEGDEEGGVQEEAEAAAQAGAAGAAYLTGVLEENDQHLVMLTSDGEELPDFGSTADAVLALVVAGDAEAAQGPLNWLQENLGSWTAYAKSPAALASLVLAAHAAGASPEDFGGTDLVAALNLLDPTQHDDADGAAAGESAADDDGGAGALPWILALGAVVVVVAVLVVVQRRSRYAADDAGGEPDEPDEADEPDGQDGQDEKREEGAR